MGEIFDLLGKPVFWFSVVLVGFAISLAGAFAADGIRAFVGRFSHRQRERNEKRQQLIEEEARKCLRSREYFGIQQTFAITALIKGLLAAIVAFVFTMFYLYYGTPGHAILSPIDLGEFALFGFSLGNGYRYGNMVGILLDIAVLAFLAYIMYRLTRKAYHYLFLRDVILRTADLLNEQLSSTAPDMGTGMGPIIQSGKSPPSP